MTPRTRVVLWVFGIVSVVLLVITLSWAAALGLFLVGMDQLSEDAQRGGQTALFVVGFLLCFGLFAYGFFAFDALEKATRREDSPESTGDQIAEDSED